MKKRKPKALDSIIERYDSDRGAIIPMLQDVQAEYNYLPEEALTKVAEKLEVPLVDVYGVVTFFRSFSLKPRGEHLVTTCLGTACHVRGAPRILDEMERRLDVVRGQTSRDGEFTLETVNCLGCCAIGPIVVVDGEYYGEMSTRKVAPLLRKYGKDGDGKGEVEKPRAAAPAKGEAPKG